jgi:flagellar basal body-associated protein FliL
MPTKLKGMTSLEIAIIVAIVLVIAIAVGWYLYTTFAAAGQQSGLVVTSAKACTDGTLRLNVVPQGASQVVIVGVEFAGNSITTTITVSSPTTVNVTTGLPNLQAGQVLTGRVILSSGAMAPFTATVVVCQG